MNRRSFFTKLGLAAASMAILPAATTYARHWVKPTPAAVILTPKINPAWVNAQYQIAYVWHRNAFGILQAKVGEPLPEGCRLESNPMRFSTGKDGLIYKVEPFIMSP